MLLKYGKANLKLPSNIKKRLKPLKLKQSEPLENPTSRITEVLRKPDKGPGIREICSSGEKICILVNDPTRVARTELILPLLLKELNAAGVADSDIFVQFAEGLHRSTTNEEMDQIVGSHIRKKVRLYNHDAFDPSIQKELGRTSRGTLVQVNRRVVNADRRIIIGSINYHFFAGFGGGYKSLVPGVAGKDTVEANHSFMLNPDSRLGVLDGNPVHEDLKEAARMVGCDYAIYSVLNETKEILEVFGGEVDAVHRKGCLFVEQTYGVKITEPGDIVLVSCGGYPKDINVYQAQKTLENASQAVKKDGVIVFIAECPEGPGSDKYYEYARKYKTLPELKEALTANFEIGGHKAYAVARVTARCDVMMVTELSTEVSHELGFIKYESIEVALEKAMQKVKEDPLIYYMPEGSITTPIIG